MYLHTSNKWVIVLVSTVLIGCQTSRDDGKLDTVLAKLDNVDKRLQRLERTAGAASAARQRPRRPDPKEVYFVPVSEQDPYIGAEHAKVTIVEVGEFACPYCAMLNPALEDLLAKHGSDVKLVSKTLLVHPQLATEPALAACAAHQQDKFGDFKKELWQRSWSLEQKRPQLHREQLAPEALEALAGDLGLNVAQFKADMQGDTCKQMLGNQRRQLHAIGVRSTPTLFINGRPYSGPRTFEGLQAVVLAEVKRADAAIAKGTKVADYYSETIKQGRRTL